MAGKAGSLLDLHHLDILASGNTAVHRIDPRAKVLTTALFVILTVSFDKYEVSSLLPLFLFPVCMVSLAGLPVRYMVWKVLFLLPFVLFVGIFNPFIDTAPMTHIGPYTVSGGWVSFFSIVLRFLLTASAALVLIATTGFSDICTACEKLGLPKAFAVQLLFLYRYIFVLGDEASRVSKARALRSSGRRGMEPGVFGSIAGHLLLRTWDRAQRIHMAMLCRGFRGEFQLSRQFKAGTAEAVFVAGWTSFFVLCRIIDIPSAIGGIFTEVFR